MAASPPALCRLLVAITVFCTLISLAITVCTKPTVPDYAYTLSEDLQSYPENYTFEVVCIPGYLNLGDDELLCMPSGDWNATEPECKPTEGQYPWWMLLIGLVGTMLLVICITPRVAFVFLDERHVAHLKSLKRKKGGLDVDMDDDEDKYQGEEQEDAMDVMEKVYGDDIDMEQMERAKAGVSF